MYKTPKDASAFDGYYFSTHVPLAKKVPGLKRYDVSVGPIASPTGTDGWHLIATLHFDSVADIQAGLASPEGQAAAADLANFADGGVELLILETKDV